MASGDSIRVVSERTDGDAGERRFQLSPSPSEKWWAEFARILGRWYTEAGRIPPEVEMRPGGPDEVLTAGVTEANSVQISALVSELVRIVNQTRAVAGPP